MTDEERKVYMKEYRKKNKEIIKEQNKEYYERNKKNILKQQKEHKGQNKETVKNYQKAYREKNKKNILKQEKEYRERNKEKRKDYQIAYVKENKEKHNDYANTRSKKLNNESRIHATNHKCLWTYEEVCELEKLLKRGKTQREIARILGRTNAAVKAKIDRIRSDGHNYTEDQKDI